MFFFKASLKCGDGKRCQGVYMNINAKTLACFPNCTTELVIYLVKYNALTIVWSCLLSNTVIAGSQTHIITFGYYRIVKHSFWLIGCSSKFYFNNDAKRESNVTILELLSESKLPRQADGWSQSKTFNSYFMFLVGTLMIVLYCWSL